MFLGETLSKAQWLLPESAISGPFSMDKSKFFNRLKETIEREREQAKVHIDELDAQFQGHL
jgi:hypothetical protein